MTLGVGERLIMLKACIVRRTPPANWISREALLKAVQEDREMVRTRTPQFYYSDGWMNIGDELDLAVEEELVSVSGKGELKYRRAQLGDILLRSLEPKLAAALDEMPMTGDDLLEFLSLI